MLHGLFALPAVLLAALTPFQSSAKPLPATVKTQLKAGGFWHKGCPVPLSGLRLLTVSHRGWDGRTHTGQLIVNARAAQPLRRVFRSLYGLHFPIRHMQLDDFYGPKRGRADATSPPRSSAARRCRRRARAARAPARGRSTPTAWRSTSTRPRTPTSAAARAGTRRCGSTATGPGI